MGKPQQVTAEQYKVLEMAGQLKLITSPMWQTVTNGKIKLTFDLPRQVVSFIRLIGEF